MHFLLASRIGKEINEWHFWCDGARESGRYIFALLLVGGEIGDHGLLVMLLTCVSGDQEYLRGEVFLILLSDPC